MKQIGATELRLMRKPIEAALAEVGKRLGVTFKTARGKYTNGPTGTLTLDIAVVNADGTVETKETVDWKLYAVRYGLDPEWLGKTFQFRFGRGLPEPWTVIGLIPNAPKYSVAIRSQTGKEMRCTKASLLLAAGAKPKPKPKPEPVGPPPPLPPPLDDDTMEKFSNIEAQLSPENLTGDGELPKSVWQMQERRLRAEWAGLEKLVGRKVTMDEVNRWWLKRWEKKPVEAPNG